MIYFDNAATTFPKPQIVYDKIMETMTQYGANPGRSGHKLALHLDREIYSTREKLSKFFNIDNPMNIIFTYNCTDSLNLGIKGVLVKGDHVITSTMEHNSVLRPIRFLENSGLIQSTIIKGDSYGRIDPLRIKEAIRKETKLIVITHMSNLTGTKVDIESIGKIAKENNIIFMVDGAQSAGVYDIDVQKMNIDILAFPGHKGLLGPQGTGGLYIHKDLKVRELRQGGTGSVSHVLDQPDVRPDKYESGTPNGPGILGLGAGIDFINETGIGKIRGFEEELTKHFIEEVKKIPNIIVYGPKDIKERGAVVPINIINGDSSEISYVLNEEYNIGVRPGLHCAPLAHETIGTLKQGAVRFSFAYFNSHDEIEFAIKALRELSKEI